MAEILIKIKIEGNSNALAFVERTQPYLRKTLKEIRQDIVSEVGELLPQSFTFIRTGIPVRVSERYPRRKTASSKVHRRGREGQSI